MELCEVMRALATEGSSVVALEPLKYQPSEKYVLTFILIAITIKLVLSMLLDRGRRVKPWEWSNTLISLVDSMVS